MSTPALLLPPDQGDYSFDEGYDTTVSVQLDGGAGRYRADQLGATRKFKVRWSCDGLVNYNYLMAFYRTAIAFGSLPFTTELLLDSSAMQTYMCYVIPNTWRLESQSGNLFIVSAQLEVLPNSSYYADDAEIIAAGPETF
jgi:hypothetical protein